MIASQENLGSLFDHLTLLDDNTSSYGALGF